MRLFHPFILAMVLAPALAFAAATPVETLPAGPQSGDASSTITTTNVFQQIWPAATSLRQGCLIVNNSTDRQWVYFQGPTMAAPTAGTAATIKAMAIPLEAATATNALGGFVSCSTGAGGVLQDAVWITGTSTDTFVAKQQ